MSRSFLTPLTLLLMSSCFYSIAVADHRCESRITYKWKSEEKEKVEFFSLVSKTGADEETARKMLERFVDREKASALKKCRDVHENLAGCLSSRITATTTARRMGSFAARKALEEAIAADCAMLNGRCTSSDNAEISCSEIKSDKGEEEQAEDKKGKKK